MKRASFIPIIILLSAAFICCKQSTSPATDGIITGSVALFDTIGNPISNAEGVKVSVENTSQFTTTDLSGNFNLSGLSDGVLSLIFSKAGFAEIHTSFQVNSKHLSGNYGTQPLYAISQLTPNIVIRPFSECYIRYNLRDTQIYSSAAGGLLHYWLYDSLYEQYGFTQFSSRILGAPNSGGYYQATVRIYFSDQDAISASDPNSFAFSTDARPVDNLSGEGTLDLYRDSLLHHGFSSNEKIYCMAFASGALTQNQSYTDNATGKKIFTGLSPIHSESGSFILP